jgi:hypothetical protein
VWATFQKLHSLAILLVYKGKKNVGDHVPFVRSVFFCTTGDASLQFCIKGDVWKTP